MSRRRVRGSAYRARRVIRQTRVAKSETPAEWADKVHAQRAQALRDWQTRMICGDPLPGDLPPPVPAIDGCAHCGRVRSLIKRKGHAVDCPSRVKHRVRA